MVPKNIFLLILILLPLTISCKPSESRRSLRRPVSSYQVEGCFSSFYGSGFTKQLGDHNSNVRCQDTCRDKGYILAATKGGECHCGNIYPKDSKVDNSQCSSKCRPYTPCYEPQSCCGGPSAYSVIVVGNIDVAKQVLRRLSYEWQTNNDYRNHLKTRVTCTIPSPQTEYANWEESFDREGWSLCGNGKYMTGLYRERFKSGDERIGRIEFAECRDAPSNLCPIKEDLDCYNHNWWSSFDSAGWSKCNTGYYMTGIYNTNGAELYHIEVATCCRPKSQVKLWGKCQNHNVGASFDREGWSKCRKGSYMAGLYRSSCERLGCIETFFCCEMGAYNGDSWIDRPDLFIKVKDAAGQLKHCSMNAMDKSPSSETYKCKSASDLTNMLTLNALKFIIEDKTPLNTAKPEPVAGPVICSSHTNSYKCSKWLTTSISTSSSFSIGTGFTLAVKVGASVELEAKFFGSGTKTAFSTEISASTSFNVESSRSNTYSTTDRTAVSVQVPANTEVTINLLRTVQNLVYKWKADFQLLGKYSLKWKNEQESFQDVTTVLTGSKRKIHAFGSWNYPDSDVLWVVITDKYGTEMRSGCEHNAGETVTDCEP